MAAETNSRFPIEVTSWLSGRPMQPHRSNKEHRKHSSESFYVSRTDTMHPEIKSFLKSCCKFRILPRSYSLSNIISAFETFCVGRNPAYLNRNSLSECQCLCSVCVQKVGGCCIQSLIHWFFKRQELIFSVWEEKLMTWIHYSPNTLESSCKASFRNRCH